MQPNEGLILKKAQVNQKRSRKMSKRVKKMTKKKKKKKEKKKRKKKNLKLKPFLIKEKMMVGFSLRGQIQTFKKN